MPILELVACKKRKSFFKSNWSIYKYDESINAILLGQRLSEYENGIFFFASERDGDNHANHNNCKKVECSTTKSKHPGR